MTYDARGRLLTEQIAGETTQFEYDPAGNLKKVTQPDGSWVSFSYDAAARLTQTQDNLGNQVVYTLDNASNRVAEEVKDLSGILRRRITSRPLKYQSTPPAASASMARLIDVG